MRLLAAFLLLPAWFLAQGISTFSKADPAAESSFSFCAGLYLGTQAEVDAVETDYPACTHFEFIELGLWEPRNGGFVNYPPSTDINNLAGLSHVEAINDLVIRGTDITSLSDLASLRYSKAIMLREVNALTTLAGLEAVTGLVRLDILVNENLISIDGLPGLSEVEIFNLEGNPELASLDGADSLPQISNLKLSISGNESLRSLEGLPNFATLGLLRLRRNHNLSECRQVESTLGFDGGHPLDYVYGGVEIEDNALGCNSILDILESSQRGVSQSLFEEIVHCSQEVPFPIPDQSVIDNFQELYGPCNAFEGNIFLRGESFTDLHGLSGLQSIGNLVIEETGIREFAGLEGVVKLETLAVRQNDSLVSAQALRSLRLIGSTAGSFSIQTRPKLDFYRNNGAVDRLHLPKLRRVWSVYSDVPLVTETQIEICEYGYRSNPHGLENASTENVKIACFKPLVGNFGRGLVFEFENQIGKVSLHVPDASPLAEMTIDSRTVRTLEVVTSGFVSSLSGIGSLLKNHVQHGGLISLSVGEGLLPRQTTDLSDLYGLERFERLYLRSDGQLQLAGLESLTSAGSFILSASNQNLSLAPLSALTQVDGRFELYGDGIRSLESLDSLDSVGGLVLADTSLVNARGLENLSAISGLGLSNNADLASLEGLGSLGGWPARSDSANGGSLSSYYNFLTIRGNPKLTTLERLSSWLSESGYVRPIKHGFREWVCPRGAPFYEVYIDQNEQLKDLDVFHGLCAVSGGRFRIMGNEALNDISGLAALREGGNFELLNNPALEDCSYLARALGWPKDYDESSDGFYGSVAISGNGVGCNSPEEILSDYEPDPAEIAGEVIQNLMDTIFRIRG